MGGATLIQLPWTCSLGKKETTSASLILTMGVSPQNSPVLCSLPPGSLFHDEFSSLGVRPLSYALVLTPQCTDIYRLPLSRGKCCFQTSSPILTHTDTYTRTTHSSATVQPCHSLTRAYRFPVQVLSPTMCSCNTRVSFIKACSHIALELLGRISASHAKCNWSHQSKPQPSTVPVRLTAQMLNKYLLNLHSGILRTSRHQIISGSSQIKDRRQRSKRNSRCRGKNQNLAKYFCLYSPQVPPILISHPLIFI